MKVLEIEGLTKKFGTQNVIDDICFSVEEGRIFGFLGQNGAGKTTTMRMILGLLKADDGLIQVCGEKVVYGQSKTNRYVGYLPDVPEFYNYMKPIEYMRLCGEISGMSKAYTQERSRDLLELVGLDSVNRRIGGFSRGMKQRLGIAQALINEPKLLICDEPTSALDPVGRKEILDILKSLKGKTTVLFSTHILSDVERICDEIAVLHKGKLPLTGTLQDLRASHRKDGLQINFSTEADLKRFLEIEEMASYYTEVITDGSIMQVYTKDLTNMHKMILEALLAIQYFAFVKKETFNGPILAPPSLKSCLFPHYSFFDLKPFKHGRMSKLHNRLLR